MDQGIKTTPNIGVDVRALHEALHNNSNESGINAIDPKLRMDDIQRYKDLPMASFDTDPLNDGSDKLRDKELREAIKNNINEIADLNPSAEEAPMTTPPIQNTQQKKSIWKCMCEFYEDIGSWNCLPCDKTFKARFNYVTQKDNRIIYFSFFLVIFLLCMFFIKFM